MVDMNKIMQQAQEMQKKFAEVQSERGKKEYHGSAGGEMIKVIIKGTGEMKSLKIDPTLFDKEEVEILEDLILAAFNDAKKKMDDDSQGSLSNMMDGMKIPPGLKGMF